MKNYLALLSVMLCTSVFGQVFLLQDGVAKSWTHSDDVPQKEYSESFSRLEATIESIQQEERICLVDSVVLKVDVNDQGKITQVEVRNALSNNHLKRINEALRTCHFAPKQTLELLLIFPPKYEEPSVFELDKTPKIGACWRNGEQDNLLFDVSCFNYHVTEEVFKILNKLTSADQTEEGPLTGTIWFNKQGEVQQIALNPVCFNPSLNDIAAKSLSSLKIKKGASITNQPTGFRISLQAILLISNKTDTTGMVQAAEKMFKANNLDSALFNYSLANSLGAQLVTHQLNELGFAFDSLGFKHRAQSIWQQNYEVSLGEYLIAKRLKNVIVLQTASYNMYPATFENCTSTTIPSAYDCFYQGISTLITNELNGKIQFLPNDRKIVCDITIDETGNVISLYLTRFSLLRKNNLLALKALSKLPKLNPAIENDKPVSITFAVPININEVP